MDDSRTLFSLLGLNGRRKHQEEVAQALTTVSIKLSELINLYDTSTLRHVHNFASIIFSAGSDLHILQRLLALWDGHIATKEEVKSDVDSSKGEH